MKGNVIGILMNTLDLMWVYYEKNYMGFLNVHPYAKTADLRTAAGNICSITITTASMPNVPTKYNFSEA